MDVITRELSAICGRQYMVESTAQLNQTISIFASSSPHRRVDATKTASGTFHKGVLASRRRIEGSP
jgi:hypothetical protein